MASGRKLGDAFVSVEADTSMFRVGLITGVKKAVAGVGADIPVNADTKEARAQLEALKRRMTDLTTRLVSIPVKANGQLAEKEMRRIGLKLTDLAKQASNITIKADTTKIDAAIAREEANLSKLNVKASRLDLDADEKKLAAKIAAAEASLEKMNEQASGLVLDANDKRMKSKLADLYLTAERLDKRLGKLDVDIESEAITATIAKIRLVEADILVLEEHMTGLVLDADERALLRKLYAAEAELETLRERGDIPLIANAVALDTEIAASTAKLAVLKAKAADIKIGEKSDLGKLAAIEAEIVGLETLMNGFGDSVGKVNDRLTKGRVSWFGWIGGILSARVALFAGARETSGFHVALDSIVEAIAILIPALSVLALGLGAFAAAAFLGQHTLQRIVHHMQNLQVIADATGKKIPPLTDHFDQLAKTIRPQVFQLLGDALGGAGKAMGILDKLAVGTGEILDRFAARIIVDMKQGGEGIKHFVETGTFDLKQLGFLFENLGHVIARLAIVASRTHIAEFLVQGLAAASNLLLGVLALPVPLLALVIGLHGVYLWAGLATTAMVKMVLSPLRGIAAMVGGIDLAKGAVRNLDKEAGGAKRIKAYGKDIASGFAAVPGRVKALGGALKTLFSSPWTWVALGAVVLIGLGIALVTAKDETLRFIDAMDKLVSKATIFNVINTTATALSQTNQKLAQATAVYSKQQDKANDSVAKFAGSTRGQGAILNAQRQDVAALTVEHVKLGGQLVLETKRVTQISDRFGTKGLAGAMALAALAGVRVQDMLSKDPKDWAIALQRIQGLVDGYAAMGQGSGQLASDLNALTVAGSEQIKAMGQLNDAYDTFIKITSGPTTGFITFAETLNRFSEDAGKAGARMTGFGGVIDNQSKHVRSSSLQLRQDFQETINSAEQMADAMRLTGTSAGRQVAAIKDVIQVLIPMAGTNKAAAAEISALAQEAGGPATTNLQTLAKWAGHTKDPLAALDQIATDTSVAFSDLSLDAQKLGTALSQDLSKDMAIAVESAVGLQGAMNTFAHDIRDSGTSIAQTETDRKALVDDLAALGIKGPAADGIIKAIVGRLGNAKGPVSAAAVAFEKFATDGLKLSTARADELWKKLNESNLLKAANDATTVKKKWISLAMDGLKLTREQADKLWKKLREQYLTTLGTKTDIAKAKWIKLAMDGLDLNRAAADKLWKKLGQQRLDEIGRKTDTTRGKFEQLAKEIGVNKDKADLWFDALHRLPAKTNLQISVDAKGFVKVNGVEISAGAYFSPHAAGGFISGGTPNRDSVPGMLMPGEVVVPTNMVQQGAVDHLRGRLPGFKTGGQVQKWRGYASGGMVGDTGDLRQDFPQRSYKAIDYFTKDSTIRTAVAATKKFASAVDAARAAQLNPFAGISGVPSTGAIGPSAAAAQAYAKSILWAYGWGANQFPPLQALWNGESGWRWNALNASSGAYGIPQSLPASKMAAAGADWRTNPATQIRWGLGYIKAVYGSPANTYSLWLGRSPHWYGKGGVVPGYAGGGTVSGLRNRLAIEQHNERAKYFGLQHSFAIGPSKYLTATVTGELGTLAKRQRAEEAAYIMIGGSGLTNTSLHHLGAAARAEARTAADKGLNKMPGGHPGWAADLRKFLWQISATASGNVPSSGGSAPAPVPAKGKSTGLSALQIARQGQTYLNAWRSRRGGGFGAAWGPIVLNEQIAQMIAAIARARTLSTAKGLSAGKHQFWAKAAADETRRLAVLKKELGIERGWRGQLASTNATLAKDISAAGNLPSLRKNVLAWKAQMAAHNYTIGQISKMLGYSEAYLAAHPAPPKVPPVQHIFGGDVGERIPAFLASVIAPFARGGLIKSFDRGGWLNPGLTMAYNGTGRSERVSGSGDTTVTLLVDTASGTAMDQWLAQMIKKYVKVHGGDVQTAYGAH